MFQNLVDSNENLAQPARLPSPPKRIAKPMPPLKINIPEQQQQQQQPQQQQHHNVIADGTTTFVSPCPSPTGTIRSVTLIPVDNQVRSSAMGPVRSVTSLSMENMTSITLTHWNHLASTHHPMEPADQYPSPSETSICQ